MVSETFVDAVESVVGSAHDEGTPIGTLAIDDDQLQIFSKFTFDFIVSGVDTAMLLSGAQRLRDIANEVF